MRRAKRIHANKKQLLDAIQDEKSEVDNLRMDNLNMQQSVDEKDLLIKSL